MKKKILSEAIKKIFFYTTFGSFILIILLYKAAVFYKQNGQI